MPRHRAPCTPHDTTEVACVLAIEKVQGEAFDVRPGMRQMHGASVAQLEIMAFANVAGCARPTTVIPAATAALIPPALSSITRHWSGRTPNLLAAEQKNVRMRLSAARPYRH